MNEDEWTKLWSDPSDDSLSSCRSMAIINALCKRINNSKGVVL